MDRLDLQKCEENYREAAREIDLMETEVSTMWLMERASTTSDLSATHAVVAEVGPAREELKAKRKIAELRLEAAWREQER